MVQVEPIKHTLKAPGTKQLKLKCDEPLSTLLSVSTCAATPWRAVFFGTAAAVALDALVCLVAHVCLVAPDGGGGGGGGSHWVLLHPTRQGGHREQALDRR